jgi:hypothetical protein
MIGCGQNNSDYINEIKTVSYEIYLIIWDLYLGPLKCDHTNRLMTLISDYI